MGKHSNKRERAKKLVNKLIEQLRDGEDRESIKSLLRRIQNNNSIHQLGSGRPNLPSPDLVVRSLVAKDSPESRQLLHLFLDTFLEFDFEVLNERMGSQIETTVKRIKRLDQSSTSDRRKVADYRSVLRRRLSLADQMRSVPTLNRTRSDAIDADKRKTLRAINLINCAEHYVFPDAVSELRNGKGDFRMSIRRSFPLVA